MTSFKGFGESTRSRDRVRITDGQRSEILRALHAVLDSEARVYGVETISGRSIKLADHVVSAALTNYETDRSCCTCDYLVGTTCRRWMQDPPEDAIEEGCVEWKDEGAPF